MTTPTSLSFPGEGTYEELRYAVFHGIFHMALISLYSNPATHRDAAPLKVPGPSRSGSFEVKDSLFAGPTLQKLDGKVCRKILVFPCRVLSNFAGLPLACPVNRHFARAAMLNPGKRWMISSSRRTKLMKWRQRRPARRINILAPCTSAVGWGPTELAQTT